MANMTIAIDDDLLRAARIKAVQQGTSVNEICRQAIARFAAPTDDGAAFMAKLTAISHRMAQHQRPGAPARKLPTRDELMDEAMEERFPTLLATLKPR